MPQTALTAVKYMPSGLRIVKLADNQFGKIENANVETYEKENDIYPLVSGQDLWGENIIIPIYIKGINDMIYLPEAVVNISRERNIVATPVLNGKGTVKEMITEGDLDVSISVAVVSMVSDGSYHENISEFLDKYPYKGVERLRKLLDEPNRLNIVSDFLTLFDLDGGDFGIVVKNYTVNQETHTNRQVFNITALSDYDYNLLIEV